MTRYTYDYPEEQHEKMHNREKAVHCAKDTPRDPCCRTLLEIDADCLFVQMLPSEAH